MSYVPSPPKMGIMVIKYSSRLGESSEIKRSHLEIIKLQLPSVIGHCSHKCQYTVSYKAGITVKWAMLYHFTDEETEAWGL